MAFRAVLFDLDGTLLDTLEDLGNAVNRVLAGRGFPVHRLEEYRHFVGDGAAMLVTRALPEGRRDPQTLSECLAAFAEEYGRTWNARTRPYDGVGEMLDALAGGGLKLAVLSNKPDEFTQRCVGELLVGWRFEAVVGARAGLAKKPDPAGALAVAQSLGVAPAEVLYLGDSGVDMKTAAAAGMFPVGALWGFRDRAELLAGGAKALAHRPTDVPRLAMLVGACLPGATVRI